METIDLIMGIKAKVVLAVTVGIGFLIGFVRGYDSGFDEGMRTGEVRELVNQGFSVDDAEYIVENRNRMVTTAQELFSRD